MSAFDENPFADPSVQAATGGGPPVQGLQEYDPFNRNKGEGGNQPAVMSPTSVESAGPAPGVLGQPAGGASAGQPPPYTPAGHQTATTQDFQRRQEELERKAAELARREEELKSNPYNVRVNNWPPLPSFMPCQPCFYQDINVDIPVEFQDVVKKLYYLWLLHALLLILNLFGGTCYLFGGLDDGSMFGLALVYGFLFVPLSFVCWFRPAYKAFRSDSSFNFMIFFFIFFCQFLFTCMMALGIPGSGGSGFIATIVTFKGGRRNGEPQGGDYFVGFISLIIAIGFTVAAIADFFMLTKIHGYYRATGVTLAKAQEEFATNVFSNEQVRNAAAQAAAAGVRQTFQQQGQTQQQQAPRY